jgi:hypothetical protein
MRRSGIVLLAAAVAAITAAPGTSAGGARSTAAPRISARSGSLVVFKGTDLQCLTFGPIAGVEGKTGVFCFLGPPKTHEPGTYWFALTPPSIFANTSAGDPVFRAITSGTHIRSTVTTDGVAPLYVGGTDIACVIRVSRAVDPGHKAVVCTDFDARGPVPDSEGFALSDRFLATTSYDSHRRLHVERRLPHPR